MHGTRRGEAWSQFERQPRQPLGNGGVGSGRTEDHQRTDGEMAIRERIGGTGPFRAAALGRAGTKHIFSACRHHRHSRLNGARRRRVGRERKPGQAWICRRGDGDHANHACRRVFNDHGRAGLRQVLGQLRTGTAHPLERLSAAGHQG